MYPCICHTTGEDYTSPKSNCVADILDIVKDNRVRRVVRGVGADQCIADDTRRVDDSEGARGTARIDSNVDAIEHASLEYNVRSACYHTYFCSTEGDVLEDPLLAAQI